VRGKGGRPHIVKISYDSSLTRETLVGAEVIEADARRTGLPPASFDLVHARTLLVTIPEPAEVLAEMVRLARPGGWVASQEPDAEHAICYPELPAWTRLHELFQTSFGRNGADLLIGRRLAELYREAGLRDVQVQAWARAYPAGHTRRTVLADLVRSLRPMIVELGLANERELTEVDQAVRPPVSGRLRSLASLRNADCPLQSGERPWIIATPGRTPGHVTSSTSTCLPAAVPRVRRVRRQIRSQWLHPQGDAICLVYVF
jgi:SAM-dependent methyltransferase